MESMTERLAALETMEATIRSVLNPATKASWVEDRCNQVRARLDVDGYNLTPQSVLDEVMKKADAEYDGNIRTTVTRFETDLDQLEQDTDIAVSVAETIPADPALTASEPQLRLLAEIAGTLRRAELERKLAGRTPRDVLRLYETSPDGDVARFIEEQQQAGWRDVPLGHDDDASLFLALKTAVDQRRAARARQHAPEVFDVKARITSLRRSAVRDVAARFAKHGRGLGVVAG